VLFAYTEVKDALTERSARKNQFDAARAILKSQPAADAGIFIFRGESGAFRLSLISKIYKGSKAEFSYFRTCRDSILIVIKRIGSRYRVVVIIQ
jgi:hypothetical protein